MYTYFRKNQKRSILRAERYGDLITAEHKVLNEGRESRNNHRYAVVVQVLATQWNLCKTKTSQETEKNLRKFPEPSQKRKVIHTNNLWEFGRYFEELSWNFWTTTLHRSETSGIAERAVHRWMISGGQILWNASAIFEMSKTSWQTGKLQNERRFGESFKDMLCSREVN